MSPCPRQRPDVFLPHLAGSLNNLGIILGELGRREDALAAARSALELTLPLARARPQVFGADLRRRAAALAKQLADTTTEPDADPVLREARALLTELGMTEPEHPEEG